MKRIFISLLILVSLLSLRKTDTPLILNIRDYGAIGRGVNSMHVDCLAIHEAIDLIRNSGRPGVLIVPVSSAFYAYSGNGILLPDGIEIVLDGVIRHVNPNDSKGYNGVIFYFNTYDPGSDQDSSVPKFPILSTYIGRNFVRLASGTASFTPGEVIEIGGDLQPVPGKPKAKFYTQGEINKVLYCSRGRVYLKYPVSVPININPEIVELNSGKSSTSHLGIADHICSDIYIHGSGGLSIADSDEVHHLPLLPGLDLSATIKGGGFECVVTGIWSQSYGAIPSGNYHSHEVYDSIIQMCSHKGYDLGKTSHNSSYTNMDFIIGTSLDTNSLISINQGNHHVLFDRDTIIGDWDGSKLINFNFAKWIVIKNSAILLPNYTSGRAIVVSGEAGNILVDSCFISVKHISKLITELDTSSNKKLRFLNINLFQSEP